MKPIQLVLNVLWLVFVGFWMALGYILAGIICCVLIITIPWGIASFRIAAYALWPFGRTTVEKQGAGAGSLIGNIIWVIVAGWWLALGHLLTSIPLFVSIIGIPFGWANLKLIPLSLFPLGRDIVDSDQPFGAR
ncbi:YccF domain-containing protein [Nocardia tenerifensis]|nr:YccF domain-containing protein [Nocardia tenerifensis]